ncbi:MAG TPA: hypothetical protein PKD53_08965 [Chloroflexaceae bacterium]|nr:hypothetical protein [Chloroflexaceae bacterium]
MAGLRLFRDGSRLEFGKGHLTQWDVYLARPNAATILADDAESLGRLERLAVAHNPRTLYDDFVMVYNRATHEVRPHVFDLIHGMGQLYGEHGLEFELAMAITYAGMVALERRHRSRPGVKRQWRLGVHLVLAEGQGAGAAVAFKRRKPWVELVAACAARGF